MILQIPAATYVSNATSKTFTLTPTTNPSRIVIVICGEQHVASITVSDSVNGAYAQDAFIAAGGVTHPGPCGIYSVANTTTNPVTVTITFPAAAYGSIFPFEIDATATLDVATTGSGAANSPVSMSLTPSVNGALILAGVSSYPVPSGPDAGFTGIARSDGGFTSPYCEYLDTQATAAPTTATFGGAVSGGNGWAGVMASYKPAGGGGGAQTFQQACNVSTAVSAQLIRGISLTHLLSTSVTPKLTRGISKTLSVSTAVTPRLTRGFSKLLSTATSCVATVREGLATSINCAVSTANTVTSTARMALGHVAAVSTAVNVGLTKVVHKTLSVTTAVAAKVTRAITLGAFKVTTAVTATSTATYQKAITFTPSGVRVVVRQLFNFLSRR